MSQQDYIGSLNPQQRQAVEHFEGPLLVLAGAGSGKTRVLTTRVARLVQHYGVEPASILAVTFTNKAAQEMRQRISALLGHEPRGAWLGTFHSIGARLLRRHGEHLGWSSNFSIYDADESLRQVKRTMEGMGVCVRRWKPKAVAAVFSAAKNRLEHPDSGGGDSADRFAQIVAQTYPEYQKALRAANAFDFDDLLVKPVELLNDSPELRRHYAGRFRFLLVDEYQDTNHAQYRLLELLAREHHNIMVVGDDDQAIYGWRGADIRNILDFEKDFPRAHLIRLEQNYRSTKRILDAANQVIAANVQRKGKTLRTDAELGERLTCVQAMSERDEAEWIAAAISRYAHMEDRSLRDFVVLYRTNAQSRALEEALIQSHIPYQIIGGTRFYERREIMDALAYLRLIANPSDMGAFQRIVNYPKRRIGPSSRALLTSWALEQGLCPLEAAQRAPECPGLGRVAGSALVRFAQAMNHIKADSGSTPVGVLLERILVEFGIQEALREEGPDGIDRISNLEELLAGANDFDARMEASDIEDPEDPDASPVELFLQQVSLQTDVDRHDPAAEVATLMTLHNAKGLEFPVVFISGLEDGLLPLGRSIVDPHGLEEERRLFYVGLTRGMKKVFLTHARSRRRAGDVVYSKPSRFLDSLPADLLEEEATRIQAPSGAAGYGGGKRQAPSLGKLGGWSDVDSAGESCSGLVVDYVEVDSVPRFKTGQRVRHPRFGDGTVRDLSGFGRDVRVVIDFDDGASKKLVARVANLETI